MTSHKLETTPGQLLARAYALRGDDPNETLKLYADWAETYDHTMLDGLAYRSPQQIAALAAVTEERRAVRVLDVGCGTGLLANSLRAHGFNRIDGLATPPLCCQSPSAKAESIKLFCAT